MDLDIKIEEEEDPVLAEISVPPILVFDANSEPVIECPDSWHNENERVEYDPLHTEEFRIIPIERLIAPRRVVPTSQRNHDTPSSENEIDTYEEEVETETHYEDAVCSPVAFSDTEVELPVPSLPPCSIKLDKNEVMKYYCSDSKTYKYPTKAKQRRRKQVWNIPPYKYKAEIQYTTHDASTSTMDLDAPATPESSQSPISNSPCCSPLTQDISETSDLEENNKPINKTLISDETKTQKVDYGFRKRKHTCIHCNKTCASNYVLKEHLKLHSKELKIRKEIQPIKEKKKLKVYRCKYCFVKYNSIRALKSHKRIHLKSSPYICKICGLRYQFKVDFLKHLKKEHSDLVRPKCELCSRTNTKIMIDLNEMEYHFRTTHMKTYTCKICNSTYPSKAKLINHGKKAHFNFNSKIVDKELINCDDMNFKYEMMPPNNKIWQYICHKCQFHTVNPTLLRQHIDSKHGKPFKLFCSECNEPFRAKYKLAEHMSIHIKSRKIKSESRPIDICKICKITSNDIDSHLKLHIIIKPFNCELCELIFKQKNELECHYKEKHLDHVVNLQCDTCNENTFIDKSDFTNHMIKCHLKSQYHCKICDLYFIDDKIYDKHAKIPHYEKEIIRVTRSKSCVVTSKYRKGLKNYSNKYICKICDISFPLKGELLIHNYSNHPEKGIFLCKLCNNRYEYKSEIIKHFKYEHDMKYKNKCNICKKIINSPTKMNLHIINKHYKYIYETTGKLNMQFKLYITKDDTKLVKNIMKKYCLYFNCPEEIPDHLKENYTGNICKCSHCDLTFPLWSGLLKHKPSHVPGKPYICFVCKNRYKNFGDLRRHTQKDHSSVIKSEKSYFCACCKESFYLKSSMKTHIKNKHLKNKKNHKTTSKKVKKSKIKTERIELIPPQDNMLIKNEVVIENISYYCIICNLVFDSELNYTTHCNLQHIETLDQNLICDFCDTQFNSEIEFKDHVLSGHLNGSNVEVLMETPEINVKAEDSNKNKHQCLICKKQFNSNVSLRGHVMSIHNGPGSCPYCDNVLRRLGVHINKAHLDFSEKQCKYCPKTFTNIETLKTHVYVDHTEERFKKYCKFCNETFKDKKSLKNHLAIVHNQVPKFLCHLCAYDCSSQGSLTTHMNNKHNPNKKPKPQAKCPKCSKLILKANMNQHIRTAHRENRLDCNVCGFKCKSSHTLRQHKFVIHKIGYVKRNRNIIGEFECTVCFRKYKFQHTLLNHYNREHVPCVCDICDRKLLGKHSMEKHLEYSHGMKLIVHPCQLCDHVALTPGRLIKHMASKHGVKDFKYQNL